MGAPGHPADQILVRGLKQGRYGKVYGRVEAGLNVILGGGEKRCSTAAPWAGGPILAVGHEVLRRRFWAQPLKSAFSPDLNPICLLSSNKELRTPSPYTVHSIQLNVAEGRPLPRARARQVLENLTMREPRPSRPLPHLSGAICTTDHVVSANLTAPRTPRAPAPGPSPLRGVLGSPPALGLPAARAFLPLQLSLTPLASSAARTPPPSSALPVGSCDPEGWPPPPQGHRDPTHAQPEPSLQEALLRCRAARRCGSRPVPVSPPR